MNGLDPEAGQTKNVRLNSQSDGEVRQVRGKCPSWLDNFNIYFTLGMVGFFVFWGTLLLHIWPPSRYWPAWSLWAEEEGDEDNLFPSLVQNGQHNQSGLAI
eukprot:TRINITY_DN13669_c0_g1_i1.p1 TRINITY_DN13669_c0_g1~~TRINITY_DN13669_c0_g1_i1.p1  ORF type:complete len:101 (-),score=25.45 TRINITY_DN13669_c0_g1_i1:200-502(-)